MNRRKHEGWLENKWDTAYTELKAQKAVRQVGTVQGPETVISALRLFIQTGNTGIVIALSKLAERCVNGRRAKMIQTYIFRPLLPVYQCVHARLVQ